jgi:hypothetical protein
VLWQLSHCRQLCRSSSIPQGSPRTIQSRATSRFEFCRDNLQCARGDDRLLCGHCQSQVGVRCWSSIHPRPSVPKPHPTDPKKSGPSLSSLLSPQCGRPSGLYRFRLVDLDKTNGPPKNVWVQWRVLNEATATWVVGDWASKMDFEWDSKDFNFVDRKKENTHTPNATCTYCTPRSTDPCCALVN